MNMEIDEVVLKSAMNKKQPMDKDKMQIIFNFVQILVAEVLGIGLAYIFVLGMWGAFK